MSSANAALKAIRDSIKAGNFEKAAREIQAAETSGVSSIHLFLFGIAAANALGKESTALAYLGKAKEIANDNAEVIRAECAVYEKFPTAVTSEGLQVLENAIENEGTSDEKREKYRKIRWLFFLRAGKVANFEQLPDLEDALGDFDVCEALLKAAKSGAKVQLSIAQKAFISAKDQLSQPEHLFGVLLFNSAGFVGALQQFAIEHALKFGTDDQTIFKTVLCPLAEFLLKQEHVSPDLQTLIQSEKFVPEGKPFTEWLVHLLNGNIALAYDALLKLSPDVYSRWPFLGLALHTFISTKQYVRALSLYRATVKYFPAALNAKLAIFEVEAIFANHGDNVDLKNIVKIADRVNLENPDPRLSEVKLRAEILLGTVTPLEVDTAAKGLSDLKRLELLAESQFSVKNYKAAAFHAERAVEADEHSWRSKLILAKCAWHIDEDYDEAQDQLRVLASEEPFVADVYAAMAELMFEGEDFEVAKKLIDHATLLNPCRQTFRELQDEIYARLDLPVADRLKNLNAYVQLKPYSMWAVKHATILEVQNGHFDEAVGKLKRVINAMSNDADVDSEVKRDAAAIWGYVGVVNFHRGQTLSTMYAFESAVALAPENPSYLLQLALSQRKLCQFDKVFATLKLFRALPASPILKDVAHRLFLETVALYAADLPAGKAQLRQLIVLFKILGAMSTSQWCKYRALTFAVANALKLLRGYNESVLEAVLPEIADFAGKFSLTDGTTILKLEVGLLLSLLAIEENAGSLNEAGVRLLEFAWKLEDVTVAVAARRFFRKAIVSVTDPTIQASLYINLGLTYSVPGALDAEKALHCFLRALQLNKNNAAALSLVGFICLSLNRFADARKAFNAAHILEPDQVQHWWGRALHAEITGEKNTAEVRNDYQHSLSIQPCSQAIESFAYYLLEAKRKHEAVSKETFFDFTVVKSLLLTNPQSDILDFSLAVIAEHFRHFEEAAFLISRVSSRSSEVQLTKSRILTASPNTSSPPGAPESIQRLNSVYHASLDEAVAATGFKMQMYITLLLNSLARDNSRIFWKFFTAKVYPLIMGFVNVLGLDSYWSRSIHAVLRENRPPHKLLEVFPLVRPKHEYTSTRALQVDTTKFVRYDPAVAPLLEIFTRLREEQPTEDDVTFDEDDASLLIPSDLLDDDDGFGDDM
uniref:Cell division cycle protein 27 homolog n=1 Tax=Panagrellus redivivus TaxID=6233 RepID=A0A7E4VA66_PANRE